MNCKRCRRFFDEEDLRCPHCGEPNPGSNGLYQTSTVLISSGGNHLVYGSVEEVPVRLRTKLLKFTNGRNSATILIADRRGRREIAKAMRNLPGPAHRRRPAGAAPATPAWLTPGRKKLILATLVLLIAAFLSALFLHRS
jgi:predicted amidophosphoribosyltransferase